MIILFVPLLLKMLQETAIPYEDGSNELMLPFQSLSFPSQKKADNKFRTLLFLKHLLIGKEWWNSLIVYFLSVNNIYLSYCYLHDEIILKLSLLVVGTLQYLHCFLIRLIYLFIINCKCP